ncbi:UBX domain-containing protein 8 [Patella vulgata]|uniref:UBX domain-containing protein 8 n=1 Tax=Patella vulgata TaxID=6465 RepID=UPI00217F34D7|nr:UBX domain-containing protein 8 [Patella vulgata]
MFTSLDTPSLLRLVGQTFLLLGLLSFIIQWLKPRIEKLLCRNTKSSESQDIQELQASEKHKLNQDKIRSTQQEEHLEKAASYSERILIPREKEKLRRKEEEYQKFLSPSWKGEGTILGGVKPSDNETDEDPSPSLTAAQNRQAAQPIQQDAVKSPPTQTKQKRVIVLPPEPEDKGDNIVLVKLRTPIRSVCQRRFLTTNTVQDVLDYMTTVGYSQTFYTLAMTYPRAILTDQSNQTLGDMDFSPQITLNIEEKD